MKSGSLLILNSIVLIFKNSLLKQIQIISKQLLVRIAIAKSKLTKGQFMIPNQSIGEHAKYTSAFYGYRLSTSCFIICRVIGVLSKK